MQGLLKAAQARKLDRVSAGYAVTGWILVQAASILLPTFGAPVWALRVFVVSVLVGFPVALAVVWTVVPDPDARTPAVQVKDTPTDRALLALLGAVVVLSVAQLVYNLWESSTRSPTALVSATSPPSTSQPLVHESLAPTRFEASIAVLPFESLSSDKDTGYFAAGIQDEILTRLSKIRTLKVISRTSTAQYDARPGNLRDIGRQLGAANILEGSVQKVGNVVRINVQLIRAASDTHLWAEMYDRTLDDVFGVESEVATAIATELAAQVTPAERSAINTKLTGNKKAYEFYLRGLVQSQQTNDPNQKQAIADLEEAVRIDPNFATAWALLARVHAYRYFGPLAIESDRDSARAALTRALAVAAQAPEVQLARGFFTYYIERDYASAYQEFQKVYDRWPNNADVLYAMAVISRRLGQWHASSTYFRQAIALNPRDFQLRTGLGTVLFLRRRFADNLKVADETLRDFPENRLPIIWKASIFQARGELDQADAELKGIHPRSTDGDAINAIVLQLRYRRHYRQGVKFMTELVSLAQNEGLQGVDLANLDTQLGDFQRLTGDNRATNESYSRAIQIISPLLATHPNNSEL